MPRRAARRVDAAQRDARAMELRAAGATYRQIADLLGVSLSTAWKCVDRGLTATLQEPGEKLRPLELVRLDHLQAVAVQVLQAKHVLIQGGKVVLDEHGQPYTDDGPVLAAINTLLRISERRAHITGLDAPTKVDASVSLRMAWERASPEEQMDLLTTDLRRLEEELARLPEPTAAQLVEAPPGRTLRRSPALSRPPSMRPASPTISASRPTRPSRTSCEVAREPRRCVPRHRGGSPRSPRSPCRPLPASASPGGGGPPSNVGPPCPARGPRSPGAGRPHVLPRLRVPPSPPGPASALRAGPCALGDRPPGAARPPGRRRGRRPNPRPLQPLEVHVSSSESSRAASNERRRIIADALAEARRGQDRNRNRADRQLEPSHGDPPRSANLPHTSKGLQR